MFDSGDSALFWLNVTNIVLGLAVIGLFGLVLFSALRDIRSALNDVGPVGGRSRHGRFAGHERPPSGS